MSMVKYGWKSSLALLILFVLTACGGQAAVQEQVTNTALPAATATPIDTEAIAEQVLAEVRAELTAQPAPLAVNLDAANAVSVTDLEIALIDLYKQANQAAVYIVVPPLGSGSGFVYSSDGYIVTNNHVVSGGRSYEVVFASGERMAAKLVGTDVDSDLAVLKVATLPEGTTPLPLGDSSQLQVGQLVAAIGNPFGEQGSMSMGIISGLGRSLASQRQISGGSSYSLPEVIQTDAPINPGNSGGPLLNLAGEVIGLNSAILSTTGTSSGVGFSIPANAMARIIPDLIENGSHIYPYLGASFDAEVSLEELPIYGLNQTAGAYVITVLPDGPAGAAGLQPADPNTGQGGDLIVAINDQPVTNFADLNSYLVFQAEVGETVTLTVLRDGVEVDLPLTIGARP